MRRSFGIRAHVAGLPFLKGACATEVNRPFDWIAEIRFTAVVIEIPHNFLADGDGRWIGGDLDRCPLGRIHKNVQKPSLPLHRPSGAWILQANPNQAGSAKLIILSFIPTMRSGELLGIVSIKRGTGIGVWATRSGFSCNRRPL